MLATLLLVLSIYNAAAPPRLQIPLLISIRQSVGMTPLTLRVKVKADNNQREVCVVVDGPEYHRDCFTPRGVTATVDFLLREGGEYAVFATSDTYRTPELTVRVIGLADGT